LDGRKAKDWERIEVFKVDKDGINRAIGVSMKNDTDGV
jgi:hypothetical protein